MSKKIQAALESFLTEDENRIGEVLIFKKDGKFVLMHHADSKTSGDLQTHTVPADARAIARYDADGEYRPLKTAPNLRRGWRLHLQTIEELEEALDFFYPAMPGVWLAHREGRLKPVHFRETAGRQSGMYDVVKKISSEQADELIGDFCKSDGHCLKAILWKLDPETPLTTLPPCKFDPRADQLDAGGNSMSLLCTEACNLLIAAARIVVRKPGNRE